MSSSSSSTSETCTSRHFSWLVKSCFPNNPHHHLHHPTPLLTTTTTTTTISALPDDLLLECLSRVPNSTLPSLPAVSRNWAHLLNSAAFHHLRLHHHPLTQTLFSVSISVSTSALFTATLRLNDDPTWKISSFVPEKNDDVYGNGSNFSLFPSFRLVSIGRRIYIISRTAMLRFDTWTGTLLPRSGMSIARKKFAAAAVDGRIYVAGGCARSSAVEEYDPDEDVWRVVSQAPRRRYGCIGASVDGVFYVIGGLKIGNYN